MVADERRVQEDFRAKLELALAQYRRWLPEWERLARKIDESRTSWLLPGLSEGFGGGIDPPDRPSTISIAATDGSQIFPDRHEISACFLINIGYILLHYGTGEKPLMSSKPRLYYREEEIYGGMGWGADFCQSRARRFQARPDGVHRVGRVGLGSPR